MVEEKSGNWIWTATAVAVVILGVGLYWSSQEQPTRYAGPVEKLRLGHNLDNSTALVIVAEDRGYFEEAGLDVETKDYRSGKRAFVEGLFPGEVDMITVQETPVVFNSFERKDFKVVAMINSAPSNKIIIGRKDKGIEKPEDLKGKKVATQRGSAVHFFLHLFLVHHGLTEDDIELSFMKAENLPKALADGTIDAFSMREPFISQAKKLLGEENLAEFPDTGIYNALTTVVASEKFLKENPTVARKAMRALLKAEKFIENNSERAKNISFKRTKSDEKEGNKFWPKFNLKVSLEQSLLVALEDEARWAINNELVDATEMPNYLDYIYMDALEEVKPEAVTIMR